MFTIMDCIRMIIAYFFGTKTSKCIINRNDTVELTLSLDCSLKVAHLRRLLNQRLLHFSENELFIHANGAPIHILDEQETFINELLFKNSNIIFLKSKLLQIPQTIPSINTVTIKNQSETKMVQLSNYLSDVTLEIDNEKFSTIDIKRIVYALKQNKRVKQLKIRSVDRSIIRLLSEVLQVNDTLTDLDISCKINDDDCILLANALIDNYSLKKLNLSQNAFTFIGCKAIGKMLKSNRTLKHLNICRNNLQDKGIKSICNALMINQTLSHLDIYQTQISSFGCELVAEMLQINETLTWIDIGDNNIGDDEIIVIAHALKFNHTLTELDVKWNYITKTGALALIETLKINHTLQTIKIQFNSMSQDVRVKMNQQASQLKTTGFDLCTIL
ncbi:hypothetical protein I4U23_004430 [Adineta vaga]|nr:hypothetical protein I4U23_004430 [Adineta vaga]